MRQAVRRASGEACGGASGGAGGGFVGGGGGFALTAEELIGLSEGVKEVKEVWRVRDDEAMAAEVMAADGAASKTAVQVAEGRLLKPTGSNSISRRHAGKPTYSSADEVPARSESQQASALRLLLGIRSVVGHDALRWFLMSLASVLHVILTVSTRVVDLIGLDKREEDGASLVDSNDSGSGGGGDGGGGGGGDGIGSFGNVGGGVGGCVMGGGMGGDVSGASMGGGLGGGQNDDDGNSTDDELFGILGETGADKGGDDDDDDEEEDPEAEPLSMDDDEDAHSEMEGEGGVDGDRDVRVRLWSWVYRKYI